MTYYQEQKRVNKLIDERVKKIDPKLHIDVDLMVLEFTNTYEVSEKAIIKRIIKWTKINPHLVYDGRYLKYEEIKKDETDDQA